MFAGDCERFVDFVPVLACEFRDRTRLRRDALVDADCAVFKRGVFVAVFGRFRRAVGVEKVFVFADHGD